MQKNYIFEDFFSGFLTGFCYDYTKFTIQKFTASFMQKFRPPGNNFKAGGGEAGSFTSVVARCSPLYITVWTSVDPLARLPRAVTLCNVT